MDKTAIDIEVLESVTEVLRAIAHPIRLSIIKLLTIQEHNVSEIYEALEIEQAVASHHLRIMKDRNIVAARRKGKKTYYSLKDMRFYTILELMLERLEEVSK